MSNYQSFGSISSSIEILTKDDTMQEIANLSSNIMDKFSEFETQFGGSEGGGGQSIINSMTTITGEKIFTDYVYVPETSDDTPENAAVTKSYVTKVNTNIAQNYVADFEFQQEVNCGGSAGNSCRKVSIYKKNNSEVELYFARMGGDSSTPSLTSDNVVFKCVYNTTTHILNADVDTSDINEINTILKTQGIHVANVFVYDYNNIKHILVGTWYDGQNPTKYSDEQKSVLGVWLKVGTASWKHVITFDDSTDSIKNKPYTSGSWDALAVYEETDVEDESEAINSKPIIYLGVNGHCGSTIVRSTDGGQNWTDCIRYDLNSNNLGKTVNENCNALFYDKDTKIIYAGCQKYLANRLKGMYSSTDGINWYAMDIDDVDYIFPYGINKVNGTLVLNGSIRSTGGTNGSGILYLDNDEKKWKKSNYLQNVNTFNTTVATIYRDNNVKYELMFTTKQGTTEIWYTANGQNWKLYKAPYGRNDRYLTIYSIADETVLITPWARPGLPCNILRNIRTYELLVNDLEHKTAIENLQLQIDSLDGNINNTNTRIDNLGFISYDMDQPQLLESPTGTLDRLGKIVGAAFNLETYSSQSISKTFKLNSIVLPTADKNGSGNDVAVGSDTPIYARLFECETSSNGVYLATSTNYTYNILNSNMIFEFSNINIDTTKRYAITFNTKTTTDGVDTYSAISCRLRVFSSPDQNSGNANITGVTETTTDSNTTATFGFNSNSKKWPIPMTINVAELEEIKVISENNIYLQPEITDETPLNAAVTKQYVDSGITNIEQYVNSGITNIEQYVNNPFVELLVETGLDDKNSQCKFVRFTNPLNNGNYQLQFIFGRITDLNALGGNAMLRLGFANNVWNRNPIFAIAQNAAVYSTSNDMQFAYFKNKYWNTDEQTTNIIELDVTFNNDNTITVIPKINGQLLIKTASENGAELDETVSVTLTNIPENECMFKYFSIPPELENNSEGPYIVKRNANYIYNVGDMVIEGNKTFINNVIIPETNSETPSNAAVTKQYVDSVASGIEGGNVVLYDEYPSTTDPTYKFTNKKLDVKGIVIGDQSNNDRYISLSTDGDLYIRNQSNEQDLIIELSNGMVKSNSKITYMSTPTFTTSDNNVVITKQYVDSTAILKGPTINVLSGNSNSVICIQNRHSSGTQHPLMRFCSLPTTNTNINRAWFSEFYYNKIHFKEGPTEDPIIFEYGRNGDNSIIRKTELTNTLSSYPTKTELDTAINNALGDIQSILETI